jgi:glycosyltransferase involved in cell wall biosynthesis
MQQVKSEPKILIFSPIFYPDIGGPAVQGKYLAELLVENKFKVHILKYGNKIARELPMDISTLNWSGNPGFFARLHRWFFGPFIISFRLLKLKPSAVLVNSVFWNGMLVGAFCRVLKIPSILKFTGDWVFESTKTHKNLSVDLKKIYSRNIGTRIMVYLEKKLIGNFTVIWVISEFRKKNVLDLTDKPLIWLQSNFHDLPKFETSIPTRFNSPFIFVTTARLVPHKRIDVIIDAVSKLRNNCKLIIIGGGSEFVQLKKLAADLKISSSVFFLGEVSDDLLFKVLAKSSAFISWSAEEGAPNSFIEALNFGLPIISANVGGIPEMFEENSKAVKLLDPDNPSSLFQFLTYITSHPNVLEEMSKAALSESLKYTKDYNKANFINLFTELIKNRNT